MAHAEQPSPKRHTAASILSALILGITTLLFALCALLGGTEADAAEQPLWQPLLRLHDSILLALGTDELGSVYITDERLLAHGSTPDEATVAAAAEALNAYAETQSAPIYLLAVPTSSGIYGDTLPDAAPLSSEHLLLRQVSDALNDQIVWIEATSWLSAEKEQYIYYRTDPCWTSYGAFCVYRSAIRKLGFTAVGYDHFSVTHFGYDYYGRLAQQSHYYELPPDMIDLYDSDSAKKTERVQAIRPDGAVTLPAYYRTDLQETAEHPSLVLGTESEPILRLEMDNPSSRDLLLLTDSFGGSMVPFLMQHYRSITAVNLLLARDTETDWRALTEGDYAQILILCGADTIAASDGITALLQEPPM